MRKYSPISSPTKPPRERLSRWLSSTESVEIHGYNVKGPVLIWYGPTLGVPPGAIVTSLAADRHDRFILPRYYPSYKRFDGCHRDGFLRWMAGGRVDPCEPAYAFLVLYGIEDRVQTPGADDIPDCIAELERLVTLLPGSDSFHRYTRGNQGVRPRPPLHRLGGVPFG